MMTATVLGFDPAGANVLALNTEIQRWVARGAKIAKRVPLRIVDEQPEPHDRALASFSKRWTDDVHRNIFLEARWHHTPSVVYDLQWIDLATAAVSADDSRLHSIPDPWRTTRMWLAPIVTSWAKAYKDNRRR